MYQMLPKERCRNITGIVYKEDAEKVSGLYSDEPHGENWYSDLCGYLASRHVPCAVSPIHTDPYDIEDVRQWIERHLDPDTQQVADEYKDRIPKVGDKRKEHAHILFAWPGAKSRDQMTELMADYCPIRETMWQEVKNVPAMLRYFCHLDCEDASKLKYDVRELHAYGGLDTSPLYKESSVHKIQVLMECMEHIQKNKVRHYSQLVRWAMRTGEIDIFNTVAGRASFFAAYFKGCADERAERAEKEKQKNGE